MTEAQLVVIAGKREGLASKLQEQYARRRKKPKARSRVSRDIPRNFAPRRNPDYGRHARHCVAMAFSLQPVVPCLGRRAAGVTETGKSAFALIALSAMVEQADAAQSIAVLPRSTDARNRGRLSWPVAPEPCRSSAPCAALHRARLRPASGVQDNDSAQGSRNARPAR